MLINLLDEGAENFLSKNTFSVCIIGTGIAGYEVARLLSSNPGNRIVMLESGSIDLTAKNQELALQLESGKTTRIRHYDSLNPSVNVSRAKQLGGTLNIWSGRWKPLECSDFEHKKWNQLLQWPITYSDLLPYYHSVMKEYNLFETGDIDYLQATEVENLKFTPFYQTDNPLRLTERLRELSNKLNVTIFYNASVSNLVTDKTRTIKEVVIKTADTKTYSISADCYILATGGIENARVLLNTETLAKRLPALGRYYMDHPKAGLASVVPYLAFMNQHYPHCSTPNAAIKKTFGLANDVLNQFHLPNHAAFVYPMGVNLTSSQYHLQNRYSQAVMKIKKSVVKLINKPLKITFYLEQLPSFTSSVFLANETDFLGIKKAILNWKFTSQEQEKLLLYLFILKEKIAKSYGCTFLYKEEDIDINKMNDASHHMGTTRMGISSENSVVNADCKVHGIDNLYVAGSSVFCTAGNANPTFTIAALAAKLGDYLTKNKHY